MREGWGCGCARRPGSETRPVAPKAEWSLYAPQRAAVFSAGADLKDADRRKDEFLAMLAHELRNPLAPIRSGLDLLTLESKEDQPVLLVMKEQVEHLVRLVDDLLDVSRIIRGKIDLRKKTTELKEIIERAVEAVRWTFDEKQQTLTVSVPEESLPIFDLRQV